MQIWRGLWSPRAFFFPPDPASSSVCTLGGNVATNAGGIRGAKYGVTKDYVLGLEVVLADGEFTHGIEVYQVGFRL